MELSNKWVDTLHAWGIHGIMLQIVTNSNSSSNPGDCVYTRLCLSPGNYPDDPESGPQDKD